MTAARLLIVNADDFGRCLGINRGVMMAAERGIVTSLSLMVRWPAAVPAASYARRHASLSVGLHVDLGEWEFREGEWRARYLVADTGDSDGVEREVAAQLRRFRQLLGRNPTHLDSHQHVHREEPVRSIVLGWARQLDIPLRGYTSVVHHCGTFYGQSGTGEPLPDAITAPALIGLIQRLPPGITELGCHPGQGPIDSVYAAERAQEVRVLCDPVVRTAIAKERIRLGSFHDVPGLRPGS
jgi:predicted glycoside hydrolase/deacetylase ChbG (UPF0249 family)